ncbi:TetR family transcriptional regulator [Nocardia sp. ET3-3]|uniref:TetR family transcriptional regulator n=1 Tax=Nocardia terrae TaxID=2675851 RepID=A0A7K1V2R0_9NOCA|nr:TetR family transcriptional regulator [Nocardia terrae]
MRAGGRTARVRTAVLEAALHELAAGGYAALSIERIAERSGVHKTTIYRRWQSKEAVLAEAVGDLVESLFPIQVTGEIDRDLRVFARALVDLLTSDAPLVVGAVRALFSDAAHDPRIAELKRELYARRYDEARAIVQAAIDRSELPPDTDTRELIGLITAPIYYRFLVTQEPLDHAVADRTAATALIAVRAGACRLG